MSINERIIEVRISTHAPRAGSDSRRADRRKRLLYFNPRSPCGERRDAGSRVL